MYLCCIFVCWKLNRSCTINQYHETVETLRKLNSFYVRSISDVAGIRAASGLLVTPAT